MNEVTRRERVYGAGTFHTPECSSPETTSHCWSHGDEPIPRDVYRICFECGHVWTKRALLRAYRREVRSMGWLPEPFTQPSRFRKLRHQWWRFWRPLTITAARIEFCQECIHDW